MSYYRVNESHIYPSYGMQGKNHISKLLSIVSHTHKILHFLKMHPKSVACIQNFLKENVQ